jgi:AcrR family transcriptional regulator
MGRRDDTAQRLETAFLELYADRPLDQITVRDLAQRAGLSRGKF